jgi:inosine-uridine nucleoside N-ribohydrolase
MGGHLRRVACAGVELPHGVDYNLCSDPEASLRVLRAGIPTRLVTADVTLQTWLGPADVDHLAAARAPVLHALARAIRIWTPVMQRIFTGFGAPTGADNAAFLHDPLALACALDESFCTFEDLAVEPALVAGVFRTLERARPGPATAALRCATAVDAERFRRHLLERLLALP